MNSFKNSSTMKMCTALIKKKLKFNLQFTFLTGISDNYIMIKTAPNRHTDHASERETLKRHTVPLPRQLQTLMHAHTLTHLEIPFIPSPCPQ